MWKTHDLIEIWLHWHHDIHDTRYWWVLTACKPAPIMARVSRRGNLNKPTTRGAYYVEEPSEKSFPAPFWNKCEQGWYRRTAHKWWNSRLSWGGTSPSLKSGSTSSVNIDLYSVVSSAAARLVPGSSKRLRTACVVTVGLLSCLLELLDVSLLHDWTLWYFGSTKTWRMRLCFHARQRTFQFSLWVDRCSECTPLRLQAFTAFSASALGVEVALLSAGGNGQLLFFLSLAIAQETSWTRVNFDSSPKKLAS